jgi:hypothetical protein
MGILSIQASFSPWPLPRRRMVGLSLTPTDLRTIGRGATAAEPEGRISAADCLLWRAVALWEAAG